MKLPIRPILSVLLLGGGFICLAVGLISFKQLQVNAPETLPKNMVAVTPTLAPTDPTPTEVLAKINVQIVTTASRSAQIVLAHTQNIKATSLSLRLKADSQLAGPAKPFTLSPSLVNAGWVAPVNSLTLESDQSFFDLAIAALQPGGLIFSPKQILATLPIAATQLQLDSSLSRLIDDQNISYELTQVTR